jgi:hypothetical protein
MNNRKSALYRLNHLSRRPIVSGRLQPANADKTKEVAMRQRLTWLLLVGIAIVIMALQYAENVWATTANSGYKATTIATGTFGDINVFNQSFKNSLPVGFPGRFWLSLQATKGPSDLYVQSNAWPAVDLTTGMVASTGWHTHPGHSLIIVTSGTITEYEADCTPHVYTFVPGQPAPTLVDPGHGHVHIIRNEGSVPASTIAVQLVPYDPNKANRRIDAPAPENCSNIL